MSMFREFVNGTPWKPFVVVWSEMNDACCAVGRVERFRTQREADEFVMRVQRRPGFLRIGSMYYMNGVSRNGGRY